MRKSGIALLMLLLAASGAAMPTGAHAAPLFPSLLAPGAGQGPYLRVQYGGDGDDEPSYQPQHSHHHSNFGGNGGANLLGAIVGIASVAIQAGAQQRRLEDNRRQPYSNQIQNQRRDQQRRVDAIAKRRDDEARKVRQAKDRRDAIRANEKRQEDVDELNKQKRDLEKLKNEVEKQKADLNKPAGGYSDQPPNGNPSRGTDSRTDTYTDKTETDSKDDVVINVIPPRANDPDPGTIKVGPLTLYPNRIDFPPDRSLCTGTTANGCFLKIVSTPTAGGGSRQECILYCRPKPGPNPPPRYVVNPNPIPTPTPQYVIHPTPTPTPTPYYVINPTPTPTPTPQYVINPTPTPTPTPQYVINPTPTPTPQKRTYASEETDIATNYEEPKRTGTRSEETDIATNYEEPKRQGKRSEETDIATNYEEPKRQGKRSEQTDIATNYEEPKRQGKRSEETDIATNYEEPKRQGKRSEQTDIATNYEEPKRKAQRSEQTDIATNYEEPKRTGTKSEETDIATNYEEPKAKPKPAEQTDIATNYEEPKPEGKAAVPTVIALNYEEPKPKGTPAEKTGTATAYVERGKTETDHKVTDDKTTDNKTTDNKATDDKATDDKATDDKTTDDKATDDKTTDNKTTDDKTTDDKVTDDKTTDKTTNDKPKDSAGAELDDYSGAQILRPPDSGTDYGSFGKEILTSIPLAFAKACTRHFRNETNDTWELRGSAGSGICEAPGSCVVKPHHTIEIHYPVLEQSFRLTITGNGESNYNDNFEVKQGNPLALTGNCAYIKHYGRTGLAKLNSGANGDITAVNGDKAHRDARRLVEIKRIPNPVKRRRCLKDPAHCPGMHDD